MEQAYGHSRLVGRMKAVFLSTVLTAGLFLLLPYVHLVVPAPPPMAERIEFVQVDLPEPPPLPLPAGAVPDPLPPVALPELALPSSPAVPLEPVLDFDFGLGDIGGDYSLAFPVGAGAVDMRADGVFDIGEVDRVPQAVVQMRPVYPAHARRRRTEGDVTVLFTVTAQGETDGVQVLASTPGDVFTAAALRAVEHWRFTPAMKDGAAVAARVRQVIRFRMED